MDKVVFLDRDGVINKEIGTYVYQWENFEINDGVFEALLEIQNKGYQFIIITNQGGIAKGIYTEEKVNNLMNKLLDELKSKGIHIENYYYSPHHDIHGKSLLRKPNSLMLEKAIARYKINAENSYFVGDSDRDIIAGEKVGVKGIKIDPNQDLRTILHLIK